MSTKTKKVRAAGRLGVRYGRSVRSKLASVESKQRVKQECPFCKKRKAKRVSKGIWVCSKCKKKFASDVFYLEKSIAAQTEERIAKAAKKEKKRAEKKDTGVQKDKSGRNALARKSKKTSK